MNCPNCGAMDIPAQAELCPSCGGKLNAEAPPRTAAPSPPNRRPYLVAGVLGAVAVVLLVALIASMRGRNNVTQAPAAAPPPPGPGVVNAPAPVPPAPGPGVTTAPNVQPPTVTPAAPDPNRAAVEAYLQRVATIERERQRVVNNLTPALIVAYALQSGLNNPLQGPMADLLEPDPEEAARARETAGTQNANQAQQVIDGYVAQLRTLNGQLRALQPVPRPAYDFARAYDNAFAQYAGAMVQISQVMSQGLQDPNQAQALAGQLSGAKGQLHTQAQQGLQTADAALTQLCAQYNIQKPFDVTDTPAGNVTAQ